MKDYKKILEGVVNIIDATEKSDIGFTNICTYIGENCPELKESEDEKIKEAIISGMTALKEQGRETFATININDCIAWLERQSEQKPQGKSALEAVNEERVDNANEIETKFKVGEWIACEELNTAKIISIDGDRYEVEFIDGSKGIPHIDYVDRYFHRWTIRDAKGGDVLASKNGEDILIFARLDSITSFSSYCGIGFVFLHDPATLQDSVKFRGDYSIRGKWNCGWPNSWFIPATKEQRDKLEKAMADAGYTFDFKKKELRKLKFRVGDEIKTDNEEPLTITKIDEKGYWSEDLFICGFDDAAKWELVGKKIAWSEEDENNLIREKNFEELLKKFCKEYYNYDYPKQFQEGTGDPVMPHIIEAAKYFYHSGKNPSEIIDLLNKE